MAKEVYRNIREIRSRLGLNQEKVARKLFLSASGYGKIERMQNSLTIERLFQLSKIFNMTIEDILYFHLKKDKKIGPKFLSTQNSDSFKNVESYSNEGGQSENNLYKEAIEMMVYSAYSKASFKYPDFAIPFEDYLIDTTCNPLMAIGGIKLDIQIYQEEGTFLDYYTKEKIEQLTKFNDKELLDFVKQKENYYIAWCAMSCPSIQSEEDNYRAFKDMLGDHDILFYYKKGLLPDTLNHYWERYKKEFSII